MATLDQLLTQARLDRADSDDAIFEMRAPLTDNPRTEARLLSVQAVYDHLLTATDLPNIQQVFEKNYLKKRKAHKQLFQASLADLHANHHRYQEVVSAHLSDRWTWQRLGLVEQALLLAAVSELVRDLETPFQVVVSEYMLLAKGFFDDGQLGFINAVLEKIADKVRL